MEFQDKVLKCIDCGADFIFTAGEQLFFHDKQFKNEPKRCKACKANELPFWATVPGNMRRRQNRDPREATVIAALTARAESGEPLTIAGDGSKSRRFVYVEDLAEGVVAALRPEAADRIYNLAGDEAVTILEIAEAVRSGVRDTGIVHTPARSADFDGKHVSSERAAARARLDREDSVRGWLPPLPGLAAGPEPRPRRVLILSADIGEGHDLPARALATELRTESPGVEVRVVDGLRAMGRLMTLVDPRRILALVQLAPLAVRGAVLPARPISAHPLAGVELGCLLCGRGPAKGDPRPTIPT